MADTPRPCVECDNVTTCDLGHLARTTADLLANLDLSMWSYRLTAPAGWWSETQEWLGTGQVCSGAAHAHQSICLVRKKAEVVDIKENSLTSVAKGIAWDPMLVALPCFSAAPNPNFCIQHKQPPEAHWLPSGCSKARKAAPIPRS